MEEIFLAAGFIQKGHRTGGKGARAHVVIGIRRDEDNWHAPVRRHQLTLKLESVHARQAYIENQARRLGRMMRLQERFRRRKALHTKSHGLEQIVERIPQRVVIVDNRNQRHAGHALSPLRTGFCRAIVACSGMPDDASCAPTRAPLHRRWTLLYRPRESTSIILWVR